MRTFLVGCAAVGGEGWRRGFGGRRFRIEGRMETGEVPFERLEGLLRDNGSARILKRI